MLTALRSSPALLNRVLPVKISTMIIHFLILQHFLEYDMIYDDDDGYDDDYIRQR